MASEQPSVECPKCGRLYFELAGVENCLADHSAELEIRTVPPQLHTQFTCDELEQMLISAAKVWMGIIELDDINDAEMPDTVALWERAARLWQERGRKQEDGTIPGADLPRVAYIPG